MNNICRIVKNKIIDWCNTHDYVCKYVIIVNTVSIFLNKKISKEDISKFNEEFECNIKLDSVSYSKNKDSNQFKYDFSHPSIESFSKEIRVWLNQNDFSGYLMVFLDEIKLKSYNKLSDNFINKFEEEFDIVLDNYGINCNSKDYSYKFK